MGSSATTGQPRRRRPRRREGGGAASSREADAVLARSTSNEDDLAQVERHLAILGLEVEPALGLVEGLAKALDLLVADPYGDHLTAREADLDPTRRHQCASAGSTI